MKIGAQAGSILVVGDYVEISHNYLEGGAWGVRARNPYSNLQHLNVTANTVKSSDEGIYLYNVIQSSIEGNSVSNCSSSGISLYYAQDNIISYNVFDGNLVGIFQESGGNNRILLNDFQKNTNNVQLTFNAINYWDNGTKGNYWSNYHGTDANQDGIGDTPYVIDSSNQDNFPLMARVVPEYPSSLVLMVSIIALLLATIVLRKEAHPKEQETP
jgi:parallel beta-helix repeat protein